jgi:hypothetical protein
VTGRQPAELRRVERARRRYDADRLELEEAIRAAVAAGATFRQVGRVAGFSHERTRQIAASSSS